MKALTLTQPWATLVAIGAKRIETRSWSTRYHGPVLIHAAKGFPRDCVETCYEAPFFECLSPELHRHEPHLLPVGAVVATAQLITCVPTETLQFGPAAAWVELDAFKVLLPPYERDFGNYDRGRFGFILAEVKQLPEPIPCRGALGLWEPSSDILEHVQAQAWETVPQ